MKCAYQKNQKLLKEYDAIMKAQLVDGMVQKVETELAIEVTYLQYCAVVQDDKKISKDCF